MNTRLVARPAAGRPAGPRAADVRPRPGGVGRSSSAAAEAVSDALRRGAGEFLDRRRRIAALSLAATGALGVVSAYQVGLLRRPPEPPVWPLDAERVDASGEAYQILKTPDGPLAMMSYAATLALAGMGSGDRASRHPWIPVALAAKVASDAFGGAYLTAEQITKHRRLCGWCLAAAAASVAMVPQAIPEARAALHHLRSR